MTPSELPKSGMGASEPKPVMTVEEELKVLKQKIAAHGLQEIFKV